MPLTSHRKGSRDGGSTQSSPVRSPDHLVQDSHPPVNPGSVRGSNPSQVPLETNTRCHVGVSTAGGHNCGEERITSSRSVSHIPTVAWDTQSHGERSVVSSVSHTYHNRSHHHHHGLGWGEKDKVILLVDGKRFSINPNLLVKHPNTMLGRFVTVSV